MSKGLDGWKKNWAKLQLDYWMLRTMQDGTPKDWLKAPWNTHHWTDMFVESSRHAPYLIGHWWAIYFPLSVVAITYLSLR